jgi:peptide deformylase
MEFKLGAHNSLTQSSNPWDFSSQELKDEAKKLETAMIKFMVVNKGIGLAANQVGITKQMFVMGSNVIEGFPLPFAAFNPAIIQVSKETELAQEGCLSYPDLWLMVKRPKEIVVDYQDCNGNTHTVEMSGLIARCFQHEFDHLNGVCFVDKVSSMKLQLAMKKLRKKK